MNFLYNICSNTLWLNLKIWCNYKVKNKDLIPKKGQIMIISNHQKLESNIFCNCINTKSVSDSTMASRFKILQCRTKKN